MMSNKKSYKIKLLITLIVIILGIFVFVEFTSKNDEEEYIFKESLLKKEKEENINYNFFPKANNFSTSSSIAEKTDIMIVPFSAQAPFGEWADKRQQDGCEEMSAIMAIAWAKNKELTKEKALEELLEISDFELKNYGNYIDTSASTTAKIIFNDYFDYDKVEVFYNINIEDIINSIIQNKLVIVPVNGQTIGNKYYTQPGPERHMIVIIGYDSKVKEFITNDPGTRQGDNYRYDSQKLFNAIRDYPTGDHISVKEDVKVMIVVSK